MPFVKQCMECSFTMQLRYDACLASVRLCLANGVPYLTVLFRGFSIVVVFVFCFFPVWHGHGNCECWESASI